MIKGATAKELKRGAKWRAIMSPRSPEALLAKLKSPPVPGALVVLPATHDEKGLMIAENLVLDLSPQIGAQISAGDGACFRVQRT